MRALASEEAWGIIATIRASTLDDYDGGLSRLTREFLAMYFFCKSGDGPDFETTGMNLPGIAGTLRASLWCFITDEPAL